MKAEPTLFSYTEGEGVATATFDGSERQNEAAFEVYREVRDLADEVRARAGEVRVLVLRGEGKGFASGGDLELILEQLGAAQHRRDVYEFATVTGECVRSLRRMPQPVIAAVNGVAAGAGAVLAMAADLRVLAERASFQFLFPRIGAAGGDAAICWLLPRVIGLGRATELLMLGEGIDSEKALEFGIANRVVPNADLDAAVAGYAARFKAVEPGGLALTKEMLNRSAPEGWPGSEAGGWSESLLMTGDDFRAFQAGFTGRRRP